MLKPLSIDLRRRIVEAKEAGGSLRSVRDRFGVAASSVSNLHTLWRARGSVEPKKMGGSVEPKKMGAIAAAMRSRRTTIGSWSWSPRHRT